MSETIKYDELPYHPLSEQIVDIIKSKTQSNNTDFFRVLVAYYLAKIASTMRTEIATHDRGNIPVNVYAMNLAPSGAGKGYSTHLLEEKIIDPFKKQFLESTFQSVAEVNLRKLAVERASVEMGDEDVEYELICKEFESLGHMLFSFDSGTTPAIKQMRQKLLMAGSGAMSLEIDEIGSNLLSNQDVLNTFLELYDIGKIKEKLIKNTAENKRLRTIEGKTPTNMMLFGTPNKLLDDSKNEEELLSMIDTGYGRRCIFGYSRVAEHNTGLSAEELYESLTNTNIDATMQKISDDIKELSSDVYFNKQLIMDKGTHIELLKYKIDCTTRASKFKDYQEMLKTELEHRYYKALKLAGTYAFIDKSDQLTIDHLHNAIRLVEDSGKQFAQLIARQKPYEKIAHYIAEVGKEITQIDLIENLPFYKGPDAHKKNLLSLATAYGYTNNIIIRRTTTDGIEFFKGETLEETNIEKMILSYSSDTVKDYEPEIVPFHALDELIQTAGYNFCAHHFMDNYRNSTKAIPSFNMIILDVDGETTLTTAQFLLKNYSYKIYTTKSHTESQNRFRIILPISHIIKLPAKEYSAYMTNVFEWLPFNVDTSTKDIARKWATNEKAEVYDNEGEILDGTLFIPQTKKADQIRSEINEHSQLNALENWFVRETRDGNRNHMMLRYGLALKDAKYPIDAIRAKIIDFNNKLPDPLTEKEINESIMITIAKRIGSEE